MATVKSYGQLGWCKPMTSYALIEILTLISTTVEGAQKLAQCILKTQHGLLTKTKPAHWFN